MSLALSARYSAPASTAVASAGGIGKNVATLQVPALHATGTSGHGQKRCAPTLFDTSLRYCAWSRVLIAAFTQLGHSTAQRSPSAIPQQSESLTHERS